MLLRTESLKLHALVKSGTLQHALVHEVCFPWFQHYFSCFSTNFGSNKDIAVTEHVLFGIIH